MRISVPLAGGIALLVFAGLFLAASQRDWDDCEAVSDSDRSILGCSRIIDGNRKTIHNRAVAFTNRAAAYLNKGDNGRAIADANEGIQLDPKVAVAYDNRARAYLNKGDNERAIADYNEAIQLDPKRSHSYFDRAYLNLYAGSVDKTLADLNLATTLAPRNAYAALWLDFVSQRNNVPSRLLQTSSQLDMTVWPAPVIRLFLSQMTPAALLAAADDPNAATKNGQVCQANFYTGEQSLLKESKDEAIRLFRLAASDCPRSFIEREAANSELKALGAAP